MNPINCCPGVTPAIIKGESAEGHIRIVMCPNCMHNVKADRIPNNYTKRVKKTVVREWNKIIGVRTNAVIDEINKIVDTKKED